MKTEFLNALKQKNSNQIPVWFMRQAGRYLPEYMAIKKTSSFREMSHTPELMKEITLQPLRRYPLDAAIMFSDILTCLEFMGARFEFTDHGPKLEKAGVETVKNLSDLNPEKDLMFVCKGLGLIKKELQNQALIGFAGAPFTLISYLIEGGTSKDFIETKKFMLQEPIEFSKVMDHLAGQIANYLCFQIESGVDAVQVFDSWVGVLSQDQYEAHILPHMENLMAQVKAKHKNTPIILYSQPTSHIAHFMAQTGADCVSVDWRTPLYEIEKRIPKNVSIQGNLDPIVTTLPWEQAKPHVEKVLEEVLRAEILNRYVFNVGHGVTPQTNTETLAKIVDLVHQYRG